MCLRSRGEQSFHKLIRCILPAVSGYGLSIEKACNIGILPREFLGKTKLSATARSAVASSMPKGRTAMKESVV